MRPPQMVNILVEKNMELCSILVEHLGRWVAEDETCRSCRVILLRASRSLRKYVNDKALYGFQEVDQAQPRVPRLIWTCEVCKGRRGAHYHLQHGPASRAQGEVKQHVDAISPHVAGPLSAHHVLRPDLSSQTKIRLRPGVKHV